MSAVWPDGIHDPPEKSDFPKRGPKPLKMKSPEKTSKLLKQMAYQFGSVLVGIAKLNPDWVYRHPMARRGFDPDLFQTRLPKAFIHRMVPGEPVHDFVEGWKEAALQTRSLAVWGTRQWFAAAAAHLAGQGFDVMLRPRWLKLWLLAHESELSPPRPLK